VSVQREVQSCLFAAGIKKGECRGVKREELFFIPLSPVCSLFFTLRAHLRNLYGVEEIATIATAIEHIATAAANQLAAAHEASAAANQLPTAPIATNIGGFAAEFILLFSCAMGDAIIPHDDHRFAASANRLSAHVTCA